MRATAYKFAHHRTIEGERCLVWGNGIGDVLIPVAASEYAEAMGDRAWAPNALVNSGEDDMLNVYFRNATRPTTFYGRLFGGASPSDTSTIATMGTEVATSGSLGYAAVSWTANTTDFGAPAQVTTSQTTTSVVKTFTATGTWAVANHLALCSVATGTTGTPGLIAWVALSTARTLVATDTLDVSVAVGLD